MRNWIDIVESEEGDLIAVDGDLQVTSANSTQGIFQVINSLLRTEPDDFILFPTFGVPLDYYRGYPNTPTTAKLIANTIADAIVDNTDLYPFEVNIETFPINKEAIGFIISIPTVASNETYFTVYNTTDNQFHAITTKNLENIDYTIKRKLPPAFNSREMLWVSLSSIKRKQK